MNMTNEFAENQKISHDKDVLFLIQKLKKFWIYDRKNA